MLLGSIYIHSFLIVPFYLQVMPEKSFFGRRPPFPLFKKDIKIVIGDPIEFDLPRLRQTARSLSQELPYNSIGWPDCSSHGLNEGAQQWLYTNISDHIRNVMERLRGLATTLTKLKVWGAYFAFTSPENISANATQMTFWFKIFWAILHESRVVEIGLSARVHGGFDLFQMFNLPCMGDIFSWRNIKNCIWWLIHAPVAHVHFKLLAKHFWGRVGLK